LDDGVDAAGSTDTFVEWHAESRSVEIRAHLKGAPMKFHDLPPNSGKVVATEHVAVYRDAAGVLSAISSVCPHRGCDVAWNGHDKQWVCPCHGSRFAPDGSVVRGPAVSPLSAVPLPADPVRERS
jgi:Rieske Fe-S protein